MGYTGYGMWDTYSLLTVLWDYEIGAYIGHFGRTYMSVITAFFSCCWYLKARLALKVSVSRSTYVCTVHTQYVGFASLYSVHT